MGKSSKDESGANRLEDVTYYEDYWKDGRIEEWQNERLGKYRATESWWLGKGPHGFEMVKYLGHLKMLQNFCMKTREIPPLMDHQLYTFLKTCNYYVNKAYKLILKHYELRNNIEETFQFRNPYLKEIQNVWSYVKFTALPNLSIRNTKLIFIGLWNYDPSAFQFIPVLRFFNMAIEACTMCYNMHTSYEFVIDGEGFSLSHIPSYMRAYFFRFVRYLLYGFPLNVKAIHMVHASDDVITLIHTLSELISNKIPSKIYYHSYNVDNLNSLFRTLGKKNLPSDIEGSGDCVYVNQQRFQHHVESLWGWFQREEAEWTTLVHHISSESDISIGSVSSKKIDISQSDPKLDFRIKSENIHNKIMEKLIAESEHTLSSSSSSDTDSDEFMKNERDGFKAQIEWLDTISIVKEHYNKRMEEKLRAEEKRRKGSTKQKKGVTKQNKGKTTKTVNIRRRNKSKTQNKQSTKLNTNTSR